MPFLKACHVKLMTAVLMSLLQTEDTVGVLPSLFGILYSTVYVVWYTFFEPCHTYCSLTGITVSLTFPYLLMKLIFFLTFFGLPAYLIVFVS